LFTFQGELKEKKEGSVLFTFQRELIVGNFLLSNAFLTTTK